MNTAINALFALVPMGVMLIGMLKMLHRSQALMERHTELQQECAKASERASIAMLNAQAATRQLLKLAEASEKRAVLPEARALALDVLRALHDCPTVPPAPTFKTHEPGSGRFALLELA
jgi:hypothetical protein